MRVAQLSKGRLNRFWKGDEKRRDAPCECEGERDERNQHALVCACQLPSGEWELAVCIRASCFHVPASACVDCPLSQQVPGAPR